MDKYQCIFTDIECQGVKGVTKKILLNVTDEMHEALQSISKTEDKVIAAIIRRAVAVYLSKEYGLEMTQSIQLGGNRRGDIDKNEDE
jgi:hypothetical protein